MATDSPRSAVSGLHTHCSRGGCLWRFTANITEDCGCAITSDEICVEKHHESTKEVIPCRSLFTYRGLCENLRQDTIRSRSNTLPQRWPSPCRCFGHFIQAFEIASRQSKGKCANMSIFSSETKTSDTRAAWRVPSRPGLRFRLSPQSAVAGKRFYCSATNGNGLLSERMNAPAIPSALKATLG